MVDPRNAGGPPNFRYPEPIVEHSVRRQEALPASPCCRRGTRNDCDTCAVTQIIAALSLKGGVGKTRCGVRSRGVRRRARTTRPRRRPRPAGKFDGIPGPARTPYTTSDVLFDGREGVAADAIVASGWDSLISLIPSERALEHRATPNGDDSSTRLRRSLVGVTGQFDLVLIDCPPSLGELTRNALYAATDALVVTEPSFFAVNGAEQALEAVSIVAKHGNPGLRPIGIVANRVRPTLPEHNYRMDELRSAFGTLFSWTSRPSSDPAGPGRLRSRPTLDEQRRRRHQHRARQTA